MHDIQPACTRILFKNQVNVHIESLVNDSAYQMKRSMILVNKPNSDWSSVIQSTEILTDRSENVTKWQDYAILSHFSKQKRTTLSRGTYSCMLTPSNSNKEKMRLFWIPLCNSDILCIFRSFVRFQN